ncbi:hypothetical protein ACHHYP_13677 [Achlya hypogyna]|uniref:Uncharacterized protein n=1 Tax=Achlya hypogyna TaxID=1202772 RepID=A0A1V9YEW7_ACHHY|nr:hypothetical protein ACHHYP_13677 [Achlya hypogyna]
MAAKAAIEAQARKELKARLRRDCLTLGVDLERIFDGAPGLHKDKDLISQASFHGILASHEIALTDAEKELLLVFCTPAGLLSRAAFVAFVDVLKPPDHVNPDLVFPSLPQPFRRILKILEEDIVDRAWTLITSTMAFKLQQGEMNADLQEKEAKARVCAPGAVLDLGDDVAACVGSADHELVALLHTNNTVEVLDSSGVPVVAATKLVPDLFAIQGLSSPLRPFLLGGMRHTFVALWARRRPAGEADSAPDPAFDGVESLVHVYSFASTGFALRLTLVAKEPIARVLLSDDVAFAAIMFDHGLLQAFATGSIVAVPTDAPPTALNPAVDCVLEVDAGVFNVAPVAKAVAIDTTTAKSDKGHAKGKGKDLEAEATAALPEVYDTYLFASFLLSDAGTWQVGVASQHKLLVYGLGARDTPPTTTVVVAAPITCALAAPSHALVALGLANGAVLVWHVHLQIEYSALGRHGAPVKALYLHKSEYLVSLSAANELHFYDLCARSDMLAPHAAFILGLQHDPCVAPTKVDSRLRAASLVRVVDGLQPFASIHGFQELPIVFATLEDGLTAVYDARNGLLIGSLGLGDGLIEWRDGHWLLAGDHAWAPAFDARGHRWLSQFTTTGILETCFPLVGKRTASEYYTAFLSRRTGTPSALESTKAKRPSVITQRRRVQTKPTPGAPEEVGVAAKAADVNLSLEAPVVAPKKTVDTVLQAVLRRQVQMAVERDARMSKRRADILKALHAW